MRQPLLAMLVATLFVVGCGAQDQPSAPSATQTSGSPATSDPAPTSPSSPPSPANTGTRIKTGDSDFGSILFDGTGQAIYLFDKETTPRPDCYGACAEAWPPVLTEGNPRAAGTVKSTLLGTTRRTDGSTQVTYAGHPLYFYAHEGKNEVLCHNITEYGGLWLVVTPRGAPAA